MAPTSVDWLLGAMLGLSIVSATLASLGAATPPAQPNVPDRVVISAAGPGVAGAEVEGRQVHTPPSASPGSAPAARDSGEPQPVRKRSRLRRRTPGSTQGEEPSGGGGSGEANAEPAPSTGELDDEARAAVEAYRLTLTRFLSARYRVRGTGLDPDALAVRRVRAVVQIDEHRNVIDFQVVSSGYPAFDSAAETTLRGLKDAPLPEPPPGFPGPLQQSLRVSFVCRPGACD